MLAQGKPSKLVADALGIAKATVDVHVRNIGHKLRMRTSYEIGIYAKANGYA